MELTVYQALDYAAKLRMPMDTTPTERHKRIMEVLDDLDLTQRKDLQVSRLSGGQQKRVSIGVELLTKPGLFFLDEPTSGLDPGTETIFMQLMRRLADQGRTIVLVTHATKNVMLADKVVFLARGGYLAWFGPPDEALRYFDQYRSERERRTSGMEFDLIYNILEDASRGNPQQWAERYQAHPAFQQYVVQPLQHSKQKILAAHQRGSVQGEAARAIKGLGSFAVTRFYNLIGAIRQFVILSARNIKIISRDRTGLFLMLAVAPLVGLLDLILAGAMGSALFDYQDGDFANAATSLFILVIYGVLVGGLSQMREIVKEQAIYKRERMVNIQILPYVLSKMWVAALLALYHAAAYLILHYIGFTMPGGWIVFALSYITIVLSTYAGMMLGLFASALAPNANSVPLILILLMVPQIVLAGALVPLPGTVTGAISARWAFEALMGITGPGSDVAADPCWALPEEEREELTNEDKEARACRCMGAQVFNQYSCEFPGLGQFYDPAIDEPEPVEPAEVGAPPGKPACRNSRWNRPTRMTARRWQYIWMN
jgi:ABC-type multidrug transport system ATPase subunit